MAWPVSPQFQAALSASHQISVMATITSPGTDRIIATLPVVGGSVTVDRTAAVRRSCTAEIAITGDLLATLPTADSRSILDPYGNELSLWRGIQFYDGTTELIPLGVFRIDTTTVTRSGTGSFDTLSRSMANAKGAAGRQLTITGTDRSQSIADAKYALSTWTINRGTNVVSAITALINDRMPTNPQVVATATGYTTPLLILDGQVSPWDTAGQLATAAGMEVFFDQTGTLIIQDVPDPTVDPADWTFAEGDGCTLLQLDRAYGATPAYNAVIITGENGQGDVPVVGSAFDNNTSSPTYYWGPYGQRPLAESNPLALTSAQATKMAATRLKSLTGISEQVQISAICNPAIDADDIIHVHRAITGFDDDLLVESLTIPLDATSAMSITCRTRRIPG